MTATREGAINVEMDGVGKPVEIDLTEFRDIDYGFAATVHRSQGMTVDRAFLLGHRMMHRHAVYVALSRHRESVAVSVGGSIWRPARTWCGWPGSWSPHNRPR